MIYQVPNLITNISTYFCPDQATINDGKGRGVKGNFVIGDQAEAEALLKINQDEYLPTVEDLFTVSKDIDPDPLNTTWVVCDLDTELPNTDVDYNVFSPKDGTYSLVTGLDNAKIFLEETKQNYITWFIQIITLTSWLKTNIKFN